jgi:hypothetical protein
MSKVEEIDATREMVRELQEQAVRVQSLSPRAKDLLAEMLALSNAVTKADVYWELQAVAHQARKEDDLWPEVTALIDWAMAGHKVNSMLTHGLLSAMRDEDD